MFASTTTTTSPTDTVVFKGDGSTATDTVLSEDFSLDVTSTTTTPASPFKKLFTCCLPSSDQHAEEEDHHGQRHHVMDNVDEMIKSRSIPAIPVKKVGNGNTKQVDETSSDDSSDDDSSDEIDSSLAAKRHWMIGVQIAVVTGIVAAQLLKFA